MAESALVPVRSCDAKFPVLTVTASPLTTWSIIIFNLAYAATTAVWCDPEIAAPAAVEFGNNFALSKLALLPPYSVSYVAACIAYFTSSDPVVAPFVKL